MAKLRGYVGCVVFEGFSYGVNNRPFGFAAIMKSWCPHVFPESYSNFHCDESDMDNYICKDWNLSLNIICEGTIDICLCNLIMLKYFCFLVYSLTEIKVIPKSGNLKKSFKSWTNFLSFVSFLVRPYIISLCQKEYFTDGD